MLCFGSPTMNTDGGRCPLAPPPAPAYDDSQLCSACHCKGLVSWNSSISTWRMRASRRSCTQPDSVASRSSASATRSRSAMSINARSRLSAAYSLSSARASAAMRPCSTKASCACTRSAMRSSARCTSASESTLPRCLRGVPSLVNKADHTASKARRPSPCISAADKPAAASCALAPPRPRVLASSRRLCCQRALSSSSAGCASPGSIGTGSTEPCSVPAASASSISTRLSSAASSHLPHWLRPRSRTIAR